MKSVAYFCLFLAILAYFWLFLAYLRIALSILIYSQISTNLLCFLRHFFLLFLAYFCLFFSVRPVSIYSTRVQFEFNLSSSLTNKNSNSNHLNAIDLIKLFNLFLFQYKFN